jgi:phosphoglycerate dehydrogenase-like enzyme
MHVIATLEHAAFLQDHRIPHTLVDSHGLPLDIVGEPPAGALAVWASFSLTRSGFRRVMNAWGNRVRWVHSDAAGTDHLDLPDDSELPLRVTSAHEAQTRGVAEWVVASILWDAKDLASYQRRSDAGVWQPGGRSTTVQGRTVAFLGTGAILQHCLPALHGLGLSVVGCNTGPYPVEGVTVLTFREWVAALRQASWVVVAVPLTEDTEGLVDLGVLANLDQACLINVGRGKVVAKGAIREALRQGWLRSAVLDVHRVEPLPSDDPLWRDERVLVLPHDTWRTDGLRHSRELSFLGKYRSLVAE